MTKRRSPESIDTIEARLLVASVALSESWDAVTMPDLAKAANIAVGTLYRIAPSKLVLGQRLEVLARAAFDKHVFAAFPARLNLQQRFELIWKRMGDFALANPDIARFIACKGWPADCAFMRASTIFARDGEATGEMRPMTGVVAAALVWGPLSALLRDRTCSRDSLDQLQIAAWDGLRAPE
jgi:AcrR family transcriptional regulator